MREDREAIVGDQEFALKNRDENILIAVL